MLDMILTLEQLAEEFGGQFDCIGENMEKYITSSVAIKIDPDNGKTITYKLFDCFVSTSLLNLVDNLSEIYKKEHKACMERKNIKSEFDFIGLKNNKLRYKCKECLLLRKGIYP